MTENEKYIGQNDEEPKCLRQNGKDKYIFLGKVCIAFSRNIRYSKDSSKNKLNFLGGFLQCQVYHAKTFAKDTQTALKL